MVSRPVDVKKIVLLGLAAVVLIFSNLGIVLARHWPFSQERVTQSLQSTVLARGEIAHHAGQEGKVASIALSVRDGRNPGCAAAFRPRGKPPLHGVTSFRAHVTIPPGDAPFLHKVRLTGDFGIEDGQFTMAATQAP